MLVADNHSGADEPTLELAPVKLPASWQKKAPGIRIQVISLLTDLQHHRTRRKRKQTGRPYRFTTKLYSYMKEGKSTVGNLAKKIDGGVGRKKRTPPWYIGCGFLEHLRRGRVIPAVESFHCISRCPTSKPVLLKLSLW